MLRRTTLSLLKRVQLNRARFCTTHDNGVEGDSNNMVPDEFNNTSEEIVRLSNAYSDEDEFYTSHKFENIENSVVIEKTHHMEELEPLGIFSKSDGKEKRVEKVTKVEKSIGYENQFFNWIEQSEVNKLNSSYLRTRYDQHIEWTLDGKLWHFPINNEQGMDEEHATKFQDHVFINRHLKKGFPKKGPIRSFMELVCLGLSQNPYMSVKEKVEHIDWYRMYFSDKKELVDEAVETSRKQAELEAKIRADAQ